MASAKPYRREPERQDARRAVTGEYRNPLRQQVEHVTRLHRRDLAAGFGEVYLPHAIERKYPHAAKTTE